MRVLTCMGDARDINTWSNIPWFLLRAGRRAGFLHDGWRARPDELRLHRILWNFRRMLVARELGGFQYSRTCLTRLLAHVGDPNAPSEFVAHFPLFPPADTVHGRLNFYIDATLAQCFEEYGRGKMVGPRIRREALAREAEQYAAADRIVCMAGWAARSVVHRYGIEPCKVHVVPGGANILDDDLKVPVPDKPVPLQPIRLGFIGKDWARKGLLFLLEAAAILRDRGHEVEVIGAGFPARKGPRHPLLRAAGFIDKNQDMARFVKLVRSFHFGCLFSQAEAFGLSTVECLRLGVPVLARRAGGIPDTVPHGLGHLFEPDAPPDAVADAIEVYLCDLEAYRELRRRVAMRAQEFSWGRAVEKLIAIWNGSDEYTYSPTGAV